MENALDAHQLQYDGLLEIKEERIAVLNQQISNWQEIDQNHQESIVLLEQTVADRDRTIKRSRFHKWVLGSALAITTGLLLLN